MNEFRRGTGLVIRHWLWAVCCVAIAFFCTVWMAPLAVGAGTGEGAGGLELGAEALERTLGGFEEELLKCAGQFKELGTLKQIEEQLKVVKVPAVPPTAPETRKRIADKQREVDAAKKVGISAVPANRTAEILEAAKGLLDGGEKSLLEAERLQKLGQRKAAVEAAIAARRVSLAMEWEGTERLMVLGGVAGLAEHLALPLAEEFLRREWLRGGGEFRLVKQDSKVWWLGFERSKVRQVVEVRRMASDAQADEELKKGVVDLVVWAPSPSEQAGGTGIHATSKEFARVIALDALAVLGLDNLPPDRQAKPKKTPPVYHANIAGNGGKVVIPSEASDDAYLRAAIAGFGLGKGAKESESLTPDAMREVGGEWVLGSSASYMRQGRHELNAVSTEDNAVSTEDNAASTGDDEVSNKTPPSYKPASGPIASENYKYSVRIVAVHGPKPKKQVADFSAFAERVRPDDLGGDVLTGQDVVKRQNFVDLMPEFSGLEPWPEPELPRDAKHLAPTLRFEFNSGVLDFKAKADLERLVPRLRMLRSKYPHVYLVGHASIEKGTDEEGNKRLSKKRAEAVSHQLQQSGFPGAVALGFGGRHPVDDNSTELGRKKNRRVEIWLSTTAPSGGGAPAPAVAPKPPTTTKPVPIKKGGAK